MNTRKLEFYFLIHILQTYQNIYYSYMVFMKKEIKTKDYNKSLLNNRAEQTLFL